MLTKEEFATVRPQWCDYKENTYEALVARWVGEDADFNAVSDQNKSNRGKGGTHSAGSRSTTRYKTHMEAKPGQPLTEMAAWQKMKLKTDLSKPQPSLPEYFGTVEEDLDQYCSVFKDIHPETEDPIQEEADETALMIAGHDREHGRNRIIGARPPTHRTLTQIKATLTTYHPPIERPQHPRRDLALEAAYEAAHADYLEAVREWEVRRAAADMYNGMMSDSMAVYYSRAPETGCSGN